MPKLSHALNRGSLRIPSANPRTRVSVPRLCAFRATRPIGKCPRRYTAASPANQIHIGSAPRFVRFSQNTMVIVRKNYFHCPTNGQSWTIRKRNSDSLPANRCSLANRHPPGIQRKMIVVETRTRIRTRRQAAGFGQSLAWRAIAVGSARPGLPPVALLPRSWAVDRQPALLVSSAVVLRRFRSVRADRRTAPARVPSLGRRQS